MISVAMKQFAEMKNPYSEITCGYALKTFL